MHFALSSRNPLTLSLEIVEESDFSDTAYNSALCIVTHRF